MRECRKCQAVIPLAHWIDGKRFNLQNRKFCLSCSPFKKHNTSQYDPIERKQKQWVKYTDKQKESVKKCLYKRAYARKIEAIKSKGGSCSGCGYNKSIRALSFHHRDRETKLFGLSLNILWSKSQEILDRELEKCDLLCLNCHAEKEESLSNETCSEIMKEVKRNHGLM